MTTPAVCLHIGAMKTGTTYVQRLLNTNQQQLARQGIAYPSPWSDQVGAVRDALGMKSGSHLGSIDGHWKAMVDRLHQWDGPRAILSMEFMSFAEPDQIRAMIDSLSPSEVSVVLGARDMAGVLPAQWQTAVRNGRSEPFRSYLEGLTARRQTKGKKHFWKRQDIGRIASDWAKVVGAENVTVVTVPPRGSDPGELGRRFATAMQLDVDDLEAGRTSNESLGLTGTELLRRINEYADATDMSTWAYQHGINRALSHRVLPDVPDPHPSLRVPREYHGWVRDESARVIREIEASGVKVVGSLTDLEPQFAADSDFVWPEEIPDAELLAFAVAALTAFGADVAERKRKGNGARSASDD